MSDFVTLSCPSCGGKLQITEDIDRFACAHCGNEHVVKRSGGVVSLKPVEKLLQQTTSELAIKRLEGEISDLESEISGLRGEIGRLSAIRPPSHFSVWAMAVWLLLVIIVYLYFYTDVEFFRQTGALRTDPTHDVLKIISLVVILPGLGGITPLVFGILLFFDVSRRSREYNEAQHELAKLKPAMEEKQAELEKRKKELEGHMSVVRQK